MRRERKLGLPLPVPLIPPLPDIRMRAPRPRLIRELRLPLPGVRMRAPGPWPKLVLGVPPLARVGGRAPGAVRELLAGVVGVVRAGRVVAPAGGRVRGAASRRGLLLCVEEGRRVQTEARPRARELRVRGQRQGGVRRDGVPAGVCGEACGGEAGGGERGGDRGGQGGGEGGRGEGGGVAWADGCGLAVEFYEGAACFAGDAFCW
ncbi:hypothetical protein C8R44DRAFT_800424 [Mycena epipterygia]|nr:hypothetical protein C8R44DRAFT_800424 [Mycena epipterygia]